MKDFVDRNSIVRQVWGNSEMILLIFAGSAAEFALNRAVDWLFFTGEIPRDPVGRLFSTVRYSQDIVFADVESAQRTIERINARHHHVEQRRGSVIPDWSFRDVLYMLIDYTGRAYELLERPLKPGERREIFDVFCRVGAEMRIPDLPGSEREWRADRKLHLARDLIYSRHTEELLASYREAIGFWRYELLRRVQAVLVPQEVGNLLRLAPQPLLASTFTVYRRINSWPLRTLVERMLIPPKYQEEVRKFNRPAAA